MALGAAFIIYIKVASNPPNEETINSVLYIGVIIFFILQLVPNVIVSIKRLHDRNKNGWWILFFTVPPQLLAILIEWFIDDGPISYILQAPGFAISIWMIVELGFLRGTIGPNRFGDDPLSPPKSTVAA